MGRSFQAAFPLMQQVSRCPAACQRLGETESRPTALDYVGQWKGIVRQQAAGAQRFSTADDALEGASAWSTGERLDRSRGESSGVSDSGFKAKRRSGGSVQGSVQSFSHFRSSLACWQVVGLGLFCSWPPWGPGAKRSGDGHNFGQPVHGQ